MSDRVFARLHPITFNPTGKGSLSEEMNHVGVCAVYMYR